jgi:hypothetical protein
MERKYKCKYCDKMITTEGGMCSYCVDKLALVRKLLRMVKNAKEKADEM